MKAVTTRSGLTYEGPSIPTESRLEKVDEQNTEEILDKEHSNSSGSTAQVQPPVVPISIPEPDLREKATNQMEKFFQIFHDLHFNISFADALLLMLKFASTIKSLLANKDKLFELAKVPLNENCSAMLLKKLPENLGDPSKFLIPCDFPGMNVCHALSDLGLADRSITRPKGVAEDVFVKVGKFHFPTDFVVVDFEADPRVPLILGRSFLRIDHALIDVYGEEITLRINDESITFNLDQVMKYSDNFVKRLNVINIASEEIVHDNTKGSNPTLNDFCKDPIVKTYPFGESDFFSEEIENFLKDDSIQIENFMFDPKGDILLIEKLLNEDPLIELDKVTESSAKNLVPILSEHEVTLDNEKYICLMKRLIIINPCPCPMENAYMIVESLPSSLIPIQDNDSQREEIDIVTNTDELLHPGFENDDLEEEIYVLEELRVDNSILSSENELFDFDHDDLSFPRPPLEPPNDEFDFELNSREVISAVINNNDELECFDPGGDIDVSTNVEDDDYFPFTLVIHIFLPYLVYPEAKSPIEEPKYSFSMGYEHFITTPVMELDKVTESSAKNLVPILSEHEVTLDNESEYNEPIKDDSFLAFKTFTNLLFNDKDDFTIHDKDVPIEEFKVYSNSLFDDDEICSDKLESYVESNLVESLSNHDTLKFDH
nr:hypothetical protein [Tanacetum cinerariifolium]